ncbi:two-component system sensor histidine kinase PmrB [Candidatus Pantoea multigeneris]|uniref:histidine kinase n=1 Tax=Candidatus Pantoea multigeneris TaxID=2608357 RepID=A0ABX0RA38_9GAMM|nr:two-component system sensor histidine kinase PmrB [Pantoea multigeneris]NIF22235.1 two-component system sensor histidine kinase PmrB [Pantoea multigeneris]
MKQPAKTRKSTTLSFRLLLAIGLILLFCQVISVFWLWHESKEQIQFLVDAAIQHRNEHRHVEKEIHEAVASLAVPSLVMITLALVLCLQAVKWITRPLSHLQQELENRSDDNIEPVRYHSAIREIDAVTHSINQLVGRLTSNLERERLFTADVAHELRTPIAGLRLHLELIEKSHNISMKPLIDRLDHMMNSVAQLLHLARVGQSFTAGEYQSVALVEGVVLPMQDELKMLLAPRLQQLQLVTESEPTVKGDETLIRMLLRNLVENASRYSPKGSIITVTIKNDHQAELIVEDQGPGIDEAKSGELSKAFVRMDRRYGGIGLGLSIVSRIVQLHKGRFHLQNRQPGPGCRAWVEFSSD